MSNNKLPNFNKRNTPSFLLCTQINTQLLCNMIQEHRPVYINSSFYSQWLYFDFLFYIFFFMILSFKSKCFFMYSWLWLFIKNTKQSIYYYQLAYIIVKPRDRMYSNLNLNDYDTKGDDTFIIKYLWWINAVSPHW